jgi:hypothetical protein
MSSININTIISPLGIKMKKILLQWGESQTQKSIPVLEKQRFYFDVKNHLEFDILKIHLANGYII